MARYGADASLFLPGVGALNGIQASNWLDSVGTTAAALNDPVGLVVNALSVLGPELVTNGAFDSNLTGWANVIGTAQVVSGRARVIRPSNNSIGRLVSAVLVCTPGRTYRITAERYAGTAAGSDINVANNFSSVAQGTVLTNISVIDGVFIGYFTATQSNHWVFLQTRNGAEIGQFCEFDNVSVRELPGAHATQPTTANKPVLSSRYNQLASTEQFAANWTLVRMDVTDNVALSTSGRNTAALIARNSASLSSYLDRVATGPIGSSAVSTMRVRAAGVGNFYALRIQGTYPDRADAKFDLISGTVVGTASTSYTNTSASIKAVENGFYEITLRTTVANSSLTRIVTGPCDAAASITSWEGASATLSNAYIWGASLVPVDQSHLPYQRVNTPTDYDADPAFFKPRWTFDGSNDSFATTLAPANSGFVCTAANVSDAGTVRTVLGAGAGSDASSGVWLARQANNALTLHVGNGTARNSVAAAYPLASACVASAGWDAGSMLVGVNNTETTAAKAVNCASANTANIGVLTGTDHPMLGTIGPLIYINNALPSASERAVLRKWVGSLSGVLL
ncbi:MAG: hypothetical protein U1E02_34540 [Hydrogenophaga sp.]|nr:hypothetical protein [Hydrogenophaga sp.]MDZ4129256.1 hypothetical protein [Hydrogenophaga sp.]